MFEFIFNLFGENIWWKGFIVKENSVNAMLFYGLMFVVAIVAYFLGSINSAVIFSKLIYGEDIRKSGSGNAGMTNMMRTYGKGPAALTLACDMLKTFIAMTIGTVFCGIFGAYVAGLFTVVGHVFPVYYGFKGGKGVAASAMIVLYLDYRVFLMLFALFVLIVWATKYLSLASVIGMLMFPLIMYRMDICPYFKAERLIISLVIAGIIFYKHKANLSRIMNGSENKFSFKKTVKKTKIFEDNNFSSEGNDTDDKGVITGDEKTQVKIEGSREESTDGKE